MAHELNNGSAPKSLGSHQSWSSLCHFANSCRSGRIRNYSEACKYLQFHVFVSQPLRSGRWSSIRKGLSINKTSGTNQKDFSVTTKLKCLVGILTQLNKKPEEERVVFVTRKRQRKCHLHILMEHFIECVGANICT